MKPIETAIERVILASRWILVIFFVGLGLALVVFAVGFVRQFIDFARSAFEIDEDGAILTMLSLIDAALVASLAVMVMIASYENFVARFMGADGAKISWLRTLDVAGLKVRLATAIVAISSIHLLQVFLNIDKYDNAKILWLIILQVTFVGSAFLLGYLEKFAERAPPRRDAGNEVANVAPTKVATAGTVTSRPAEGAPT
jgi:uncharacterized protein (TIGR00645 family)